MSATGAVDLTEFTQWIARLNRKIETSDINRVPRLMEAAVEYARTYAGTFPFMVEMKAQLLSGNFITVAQARGVLNCARAEARRSAEPVAVAAPVAEDGIENGTYTVVFDEAGDEYITLKISEPTWMGEGSKGIQQVAYLHGPDNETDFYAIGFLTENGIVKPWKSARHLSPEFIDGINDALLIIRDEDRDEMRLAYALRSGRCSRCNRVLTVPASLHRGMGPECAKK